MTAYFKNIASMKACTIAGKDSASVSSVQYLKFNSSQIPDDIKITSSNDYQFTLSHSANASFILIAGTSIKQGGSDTTVIFQWYDETNSQYIGKKGSLMSLTSSSVENQENKNPAYRTACSALILASDFGGSDIVVSCRVVSSTGSTDYNFEPTGFEDHSGFPCLQVYQSR